MTDSPRLFRLQRNQDVTGVSGPGHVADGVEFADGTVVIRWLSEYASTVVWDRLEEAMHVHGHDGATRAVFADVPENMPEPTDFTGRGFANYAVIDTDYGHQVTVRESSAADGSYVWLLVGDSETVKSHSPHLSVGQALRLRDALNMFIAHRGGC